MLYSRSIILTVFCLLSLSLSAQFFKPYETGIEEESLHYRLSIGFLSIGEAKASYIRNQKTGEHYMEAHAFSSGLLEFFYGFDFLFETRLDSKSNLPIKTHKRFKEGKYQTENRVMFDHTTRVDSTIVQSDSVGMRVVPKNINDILSGVYSVMHQQISSDMLLGDTISTICYFTDEVWNLRLVYVGDEELKTYRGNEACFKFYLLPQKGYFFKNDDDISLWMTKDKNHVPVKLKLNMVLSSIKGEITSYKNTLSD